VELALALALLPCVASSQSDQSTVSLSGVGYRVQGRFLLEASGPRGSLQESGRVTYVWFGTEIDEATALRIWLDSGESYGFIQVPRVGEPEGNLLGQGVRVLATREYCSNHSIPVVRELAGPQEPEAMLNFNPLGLQRQGEFMRWREANPSPEVSVHVEKAPHGSLYMEMVNAGVQVYSDRMGADGHLEPEPGVLMHQVTSVSVGPEGLVEESEHRIEWRPAIYPPITMMHDRAEGVLSTSPPVPRRVVREFSRNTPEGVVPWAKITIDVESLDRVDAASVEEFETRFFDGLMPRDYSRGRARAGRQAVREGPLHRSSGRWILAAAGAAMLLLAAGLAWRSRRAAPRAA
jgi:hypothetical protein